MRAGLPNLSPGNFGGTAGSRPVLARIFRHGRKRLPQELDGIIAAETC
jgi:hypothetical protein